MTPNPAFAGSPEGVAMVHIYFGYSQSLAYREATDLCGGIPSFTTTGEGKDAVHCLALPVTEIAVLMRLSELVGGWKSFRITINGAEARRDELIRLGGECYHKRQAAEDPEQYCFGQSRLEYNLWGCRRLDMPIDEAGHGWMAYGRLDPEGVWHFDKARIEQALEEAMAACRLCPVLDRARVMTTLAGLPDTVVPRHDAHWRYRTGPRSDGGIGYQNTGIAPIPARVVDYVVGGYRPRWDFRRDLRESKTEIYLGPVDRWALGEIHDADAAAIEQQEAPRSHPPTVRARIQAPSRAANRAAAHWPQVVAITLIVLGLGLALL